jgi:hypothetical protein
VATFNDIRATKQKKTKWHANREADIYIYIYNGTNNNNKKKRDKQETDYNKILVGART